MIMFANRNKNGRSERQFANIINIGNQHHVEMLEKRIQSRRVVFPIIVKPSAQDRIELTGDILKAEIRPIPRVRTTRRLTHRRRNACSRKANGAGSVCLNRSTDC